MPIIRTPERDEFGEPPARSWAWLAERWGVLIAAGAIALLSAAWACGRAQAPEFEHGVNFDGVAP